MFLFYNKKDCIALENLIWVKTKHWLHKNKQVEPYVLQIKTNFCELLNT